MTEHPQHAEEKNLFGFWLYILSDCILFAGLFAVFAVLRTATFGGPDGKELLNLPFVLLETALLLASSYAMGMALLAAHKQKKALTLAALALVLALGLCFLGLELSEFRGLILEGAGPGRSAFLSSFFTLVGTHGLHVAAGMLWMLVVMVHIAMRGLEPATTGKLKMLALFWHFLDIIWIFIFSVVYLFSASL